MLQQALPGISSNATHMIAAETGHLIHFDHPQQVIEIVKSMVQTTRAGSAALPAAIHCGAQ
jgi:hypothetical protein